jgi:hypothetical protein
MSTDVVEINNEKPISKRGRKKKVVEQTKEIDTQSSFNNLNPVIFHLKVKTDIEKADINLEGNTAEDNYEEYVPLSQKESSSETFSIESMKEFFGKIHYKEYPDDTYCFWDCNPFKHKGIPLILSYNPLNKEYTGFGHFCSPNCALAYLHNMNISQNDRWISKGLMKNFWNDIAPAPPKESLKIFGGPLSIEQYRDFIQKHSDYEIVTSLPPILMNIPQIDIQPMYNRAIKESSELVLKRPRKT